MTKLTPEAASELADVLVRVCQTAGLDPTGAELIKYTINAVYRLRSGPVIVRLRKGSVAAAATRRRVMVARWLAEQDAPVVRLLDGCEQPVEVDDYAATFWTAIPTTKVRWQGADLALALRELHQLSPPPELNHWDPFSSLLRRLKDADGVDNADLAWLTRECAELEEAYRDLEPTLDHGLIHGDAHMGNLLREPSGRNVLSDLDGVGRGPLLQDLVPTAVNAVRFGSKVRHATLAHVYGWDVTRDPAWPVLRRLRELQTATSVMTDLRSRSEVAAEFRWRIQTLRARDTEAQWRPYR